MPLDVVDIGDLELVRGIVRIALERLDERGLAEPVLRLLLAPDLAVHGLLGSSHEAEVRHGNHRAGITRAGDRIPDLTEILRDGLRPADRIVVRRRPARGIRRAERLRRAMDSALTVIFGPGLNDVGCEPESHDRQRAGEPIRIGPRRAGPRRAGHRNDLGVARRERTEVRPAGAGWWRRLRRVPSECRGQWMIAAAALRLRCLETERIIRVAGLDPIWTGLLDRRAEQRIEHGRLGLPEGVRDPGRETAHAVAHRNA